MTRYIIKKAASSIVIEKRNSKGMTVICKTALPTVAEATMAKEAAKLVKLGIKFQVENRSGLFLAV